ncbi:MAG TPA: energy transducer TonB [Polyangiaceae bacterium]|nr:energy transducer TonB [Polyangiaceae bacterium]
MNLLKPVYVFSAAAHVALLGGMIALKTPEPKKSESIGVMVSEKKKPKPDEDKPKPVEAPPEILKPKSTFKAPPKAAPEPPPPEPAAPPHAALNTMPDFGISMTGVGGPGTGVGVGIPVGPGGGSSQGVAKLTAPPPREKSFGTVKDAIAGDSPCAEDVIKPKPLGFAQPQYTDDARSAEVEGRVKLKLSVDAQGNVTDVQVLAGLGHGLDESSVATARRIKFTPGSACSKPVGSSFVITFRFALGE